MKRFAVLISLVCAFTAFMQTSAYAQVPSDYAVTKTVKVGNGSFADANTSDVAPSGVVGDTVTWRITITFTQSLESPNLYLRDIIPQGFTIVSVSDPDDYDSDLGVWSVPFVSSDTPRVLEVVTVANQVGVFENIAQLVTLRFNDDAELSVTVDTNIDDDNPQNNIDNAWVRISATPTPATTSPTPSTSPVTIVLGDTTQRPTLSATGSRVAIPFALLGFVMIVAVVHSRRVRN